MNYYFYSIVSKSILVSDFVHRGPNANLGMMKFLLVQASLVLFLLLSEEVVLAFSVVRL